MQDPPLGPVALFLEAQVEFGPNSKTLKGDTKPRSLAINLCPDHPMGLPPNATNIKVTIGINPNSDVQFIDNLYNVSERTFHRLQ